MTMYEVQTTDRVSSDNVKVEQHKILAKNSNEALRLALKRHASAQNVRIVVRKDVYGNA